MAEQQRYCLVTGAAGGIGRALVEVFESAGYRVIAVDRCGQPAGLNCYVWRQCDLQQLVLDENLAAKFFVELGALLSATGLHALINNAAVQILGGVDSLGREDWRQTLDVNLVAPFLLVQGLLSQLEIANGSVVNIGSIHARLTKKKFIAYAASKSALAGMTRALAVDLGARVRVNCIEPAAIETDMLLEGFKEEMSRYAELESCHPFGRVGNPREVAKLAVALVEGEFKFMHGACIALDGGISGQLHDPL